MRPALYTVADSRSSFVTGKSTLAPEQRVQNGGLSPVYAPNTLNIRQIIVVDHVSPPPNGVT
ncbi:protein of unknown function [Serratia sp. Tan611]|nr:protein of unknown function [Serratia sp. Tan611]